MTSALRSQGRIFCAVAAAFVISSALGFRLDPGHELAAVAVLLLLLGMPHGAFDVVVARKLFGATDAKGWASFVLRYLALAVLVVAVWVVAPTSFLCAFLILSALHFGGDPGPGVSRISRVLYGGAVIVLPALSHAPELKDLLTLVAGEASAAVVVPVLGHLAAPWLVATLLASAFESRRSRLAACEMLGLVAVSVVAPPLVAFGTYFCAMHSPRHILRTLNGLDARQARKALSAALWPTLAVVAVAVVLASWASSLPWDQRVMQIVFVGLAALTLPHMALLERARRASLPVPR